MFLTARRDGYDSTWALSTLALCGVAAAIGGRAWALAEWWWREGEAASWVFNPFSPAGYASAGALVGAAAVIGVHRVAFGSDETARMLDVVAPAGLVALAMARIGCLFEGCDIGRVTEVAWGVSYPRGHVVWTDQLATNLVGPDAAWSLAVHPFALYIAVPTIATCCALAFVSLGCAGRRALVVGVVYGSVRLVAEAFRAAPDAFHPGFAVAAAVVVACAGWWALDRHGPCRESTSA